MKYSILGTSRRGFLSTLTLGAAAFTTPGLFAEELALVRTPPQTEGPFYPNKLPLDTDNDLLIINDAITPADCRLAADSLGKGKGKGGNDLGANVDLVGPGAAYERWKKTPAYETWQKAQDGIMR